MEEFDLTQPDDLIKYIRILYKEGDENKYDGYKWAREYAEEMGVHAFGNDPGDLLGKYRPLEDDVIAKYRKEIYQPVTYTEFKKALNVTGRIFSDGFYSIGYSTIPTPAISDDEQPDYYFENDYAGEGSVIKYAHHVLLPYMLGDPNAILVQYRKNESDGDLYDIDPVIYSADQVMDYKKGKWAIVLTSEKSWITTGTQKSKTGKVFHYITRTGLIEIRQTALKLVGNVLQPVFEINQLDQWDEQEAPFMFLGGELWQSEGTKYYRSFFDAALPYWNKLTREDSDHDASIVRNAYPQRALIEEPCDVCNGVGKLGKDPCDECNGVGVIVAKGSSPYKDIRVKWRKLAESGLKPSDVMHYFSPDVQSLEFQAKRGESLKYAAMEALNMNALDGVNVSQSGEAKRQDRQDLNLFIKKISDQVFDLIGFIYTTGMRLRYGDFISNIALLLPEVQKPIGFDYTTLDDLIAESRAAREAGLHTSIIRNIDKAIAVKKYGKDSKTARKITAQIDLDPYYGMNTDSLLAINGLAPGSVAADLVYLSANMPLLIGMAEMNDAMFYEKSRKDQKDVLMKLVQDNRPETPQPPQINLDM